MLQLLFVLINTRIPGKVQKIESEPKWSMKNDLKSN